jgi:hypothetical protein
MRWGGIMMSVVGLVLVSAISRGQSGAADPFERVAALIGSWEGTVEGQPGKGTVRRQYTRALKDRFIRITNRSEYPPQDKNRKGELHEDEGFLSFDRGRKALVLRQFHVEGFVNQFREDPASTPERLIFTSEAIENIPAGFRARETYVLQGRDSFEEIFELAEPGKDFETYSRSRFVRVK